MVWYLSICRASLETIQKTSGFALSDVFGGEKPKEEDYNYVRVLTMAKFDCPSFKQVFVGETHKTPVIIQTLGFQGEVYGIILRVFSPETSYFSDSLLLVPSNPLLNLEFDAGKQGSKTCKSVEDYKNKFKLLELLDSRGFDDLLKALLKTSSKAPPSINYPVLLPKFSPRVLAMEHFVPLPKLILAQFT